MLSLNDDHNHPSRFSWHNHLSRKEIFYEELHYLHPGSFHLTVSVGRGPWNLPGDVIARGGLGRIEFRLTTADQKVSGLALSNAPDRIGGWKLTDGALTGGVAYGVKHKIWDFNFRTKFWVELKYEEKSNTSPISTSPTNRQIGVHEGLWLNKKSDRTHNTHRNRWGKKRWQSEISGEIKKSYWLSLLKILRFPLHKTKLIPHVNPRAVFWVGVPLDRRPRELRFTLRLRGREDLDQAAANAWL